MDNTIVGIYTLLFFWVDRRGDFEVDRRGDFEVERLGDLLEGRLLLLLLLLLDSFDSHITLFSTLFRLYKIRKSPLYSSRVTFMRI